MQPNLRLALALDRWRGRIPNGATFAVLLSSIIPEIAPAIGLLDAHLQHRALIYNTARATPTPALNALATLILVASFTVAGLGWLAYRRWGKGQGDDSSLGSITSSV